jgi:hypothetical protein
MREAEGLEQERSNAAPGGDGRNGFPSHDPLLRQEDVEQEEEQE